MTWPRISWFLSSGFMASTQVGSGRNFCSEPLDR